ncbi:MAG: carbon-nitrogen hydrolase family protein [archaeon]
MKVSAVSCRNPKTKEDLNYILHYVPAESDSLVVFPEYFLAFLPAQRREELKKELFSLCSQFAVDNKMYLAFGMLEYEYSRYPGGDKAYLTGVLMNKSGKIIGAQRKLNPTSFEVADYNISKGTSKNIITAEFGTVGISMCKDQWYFKQSSDADIILHLRGFGLNNPKYGKFYDNWLMLDRTTAILNKAYVIGTTGLDKDGSPGCLMDIINYEGDVLMKSEGIVTPSLFGAIITADLDLDKLGKYKKNEFQPYSVPRF